MNYEDIKANIRSFRKNKLRLSQAELGKKLNMSGRGYGYYEILGEKGPEKLVTNNTLFSLFVGLVSFL